MLAFVFRRAVRDNFDTCRRFAGAAIGWSP